MHNIFPPSCRRPERLDRFAVGVPAMESVRWPLEKWPLASTCRVLQRVVDASKSPSRESRVPKLYQPSKMRLLILRESVTTWGGLRQPVLSQSFVASEAINPRPPTLINIADLEPYLK